MSASPPNRQQQAGPRKASTSSSSVSNKGLRDSQNKGKKRASSSSSLSTVHERGFSDDRHPMLDGEDGDYLSSGDERGEGSREPYEKYADGSNGAGEDDHSFSGPAHYLPLIVAVVPPLGAVLHGRAEAWTDALILLLVAFYLYQVVRMPWELYYASRTRRINAAAHTLTEDHDTIPSSLLKRREMASRELRQTELLSLLFCLISPFLGSYLLYYIKSALSEPDKYINPFNIRLFVLASGVKPWLHFFSLVKNRSLFLQNQVHYPIPTVSLLLRKVKVLEEEMDELKALYATKADVKLLRDGVDVPLTALSKAVRRYERKEEYSRLSNEEKFSLLMQRQEEMLTELEGSAREVEEMRDQQERMGSGLRALRYIFSGDRAERRTDAQGRQVYVWYGQGAFFYIFLPLIASIKVLDATGRLFDSVTRKISSPERGGMIEASKNHARKEVKR